MFVNQFLILAAILFCIGVYGVIARKNGVMVLMSIELILNAVNLNLIAFSMHNGSVDGQTFALFVIAVAAAEVGVGLSLVLLIYRNRRTISLDDLSEMKG
jgi:NADH:ubiquinone oxidoreductase subunit K